MWLQGKASSAICVKKYKQKSRTSNLNNETQNACSKLSADSSSGR